MCGIVGYVGKQQALPILLDGIKTLEYRGYDSAGLAVITKAGSVFSEKAVGKVANLEEKLGKRRGGGGIVGIIHSRWATHGGVSERNAHPHADCRGDIWVAHNGIIENYKELKTLLIKKGHRFRSETDTEVFPHLIEEALKQNPRLELARAVQFALKKIRGAYGFLVMSRHHPDTLAAVRNFSPLLVGVGDGEYVVASDAAAVLRHTRDVIYLKDGELAVVSLRGHQVLSFGNEVRARDAERIDWNIEQAKRGGYKHFMLKEIMEQPEAIQNSIRGRLIPGEGLAKLGGLANVAEKLRSAKRLHIAACGTAYYAGKVGEYMLEEYAGIPVEVDVASEFRYRKPVFQKADALLAISQSGETADTLAAVREAKQKGVLALGLVNVVGSTIARETDAGVYQHVGPEIGVASTKAFTSQVAILALLALLLGREREMSLVMGSRIASELAKIPALMRRVLKTSSRIRALARKYRRSENFIYLGRKYNFPVALEGALKIKEIAYVHAEGLGAGEMKHGPLAMIDKTLPSFFTIPKDSVYEKNLSNLSEIKARGGPVIAVATEGDRELAKLADDVVYIPKTLEMLTPLLAVIPAQLFAYHFAALRGLDVDRPRNLAKSVTVE